MPMASLIELAAAHFERCSGSAAESTVAALRSARPARNEIGTLLAAPAHATRAPDEVHEIIDQDSALSGLSPALSDVVEDLDWYLSPRSGTAFTQLIGPGSGVGYDTTRIGLFFLPRGTDYPNHVHGADEIYIVAAGLGEWSLNRAAFKEKAPGAVIEVPSMTVHALRNPKQPVLMFWSWSGDTSLDRYRFTD